MVDDASIAAIMADVWATILDRELVAVPEGEAASGATLDGVVTISGAWQGAVVLRVSPALGSVVARRMFDLETEDPTQEDVYDALGELTNTTGGNIKGLMPGLCHLSLPTVVEGAGTRVHVPGARIVHEAAFTCDDEPVVVQIIATDSRSLF